jgi:hypothetical protein
MANTTSSQRSAWHSVYGVQRFRNNIVAEGTLEVDGLVYSTDVAFAQGIDPVGALAVTMTDGDQDDGGQSFTLSGSAVHTSAWDGTCVGNLVLPSATVGNYCVYRQSAIVGSAKALIVTAAGSDTYAANQVVRVHGSQVAGATDVSQDDDTILTITPDGTNDGWAGVGSQIFWYCRDAGEWLIRVDGVNEGTGAAGAIAFSS